MMTRNALLIIAILILFFYPMKIWPLEPSPIQEETTVESSSLNYSDCNFTADVQSTPSADMNTIASKEVVKTTYVEKETYVCETPSLQLVDVYIYVEIVDNLRNQTSMVQKIQGMSCFKDVNRTSVICQTETLPSDLPSTLSCSIMTPFKRPVLLNSVIGPGNLTYLDKSIVAESRVFGCTGAEDVRLVKDVMTFWETYGDSDKAISKKEAKSVICINDIAAARTLGCTFQEAT